MKQKLHKTFFLLKLLGICLLLLLIHRLIFLGMFHSQFSDVAFIEFVKAFLIGTLTDAIASIYFLLPMWLTLLFFNIESKTVRIVALGWFIVGFLLTCVLNLSDLGYYPITKKRMGAELIDILPEVPALLGAYLKDYWYLFILLIVFFLTAFLIFRNQMRNFRNVQMDLKFKSLNIVLVIFIFFTIMRGGYGQRPFMPFDIPSMVDPKLQWLASNTPFQFLHTLENQNVKIETYYNENEAEKIVGLEKKYNGKPFVKKNVLIIILESFCAERIGLYNPAVKAYTPFMDSLLSVSRSYKFGMANGRMTIDALPSVMSSMPCFMEKNYCYSNYNSNTVQGIGPLLEKEGYTTAFFYGGLKTTFGFENFTNLNFSKTYIAQEDFDKPYENSGWGVDDHLYLPFVANKLKNLEQPFCASLLTLSLHHPFPVPEPYKTTLNSIKDPVLKSMRYTDISLQLFFNDIRNEAWFKNSIIALCADHTSGGFGNFDSNPVNEYAIPVAFLAVGDTSFNKPQSLSISQIDMYPTILDYLGYDKPFISLGKSGLRNDHSTIQYGGNGMFLIFDYPYMLEFDNTKQKVTKFLTYNDNRVATSIFGKPEYNLKLEELTGKVKAHIQVFSYRVNKNQF